MFRRQLRDPTTEARRLRMGDEHLAMQEALAIELAFDADRLIDREREFRAEEQSVLCEVQDFAERGLLSMRHKAATLDGNAELLTEVAHTLLHYSSVRR